VARFSHTFITALVDLMRLSAAAQFYKVELLAYMLVFWQWQLLDYSRCQHMPNL